MELAALAAELELDAIAAHLHVAVLHRGEAEGVVLLGVALVADADAGALEELHEERQHLAPWQARRRDVGAHVAADTRQRFRELEQVIELVRIAQHPVARVVAVLLASARVAARGLQVPALVAADPDRGPRRRNREPLESFDLRLVGHALALRVEVGEALAGRLAAKSLLAVARIAQPAQRRGARPCRPCVAVRHARGRFRAFRLVQQDS